MPNPLFSTYRAGENRITSSTMAVFERIDLALVQELLQGAGRIGSELTSVSFENQVSGEGSVPDARISGCFTWWFETKTVRGGYDSEGHDRKQLREHSTRLVDDPDSRLFVLTPDPGEPEWFRELDGVDEAVRDRVVWLSFAGLAEVIQQILGEPTRLVSEQTRFLLSELVALYDSDGLLTSDDTVIVAARAAWGDYLKYSAYVCQPDRAFRRGLTHFGFYYKGQIMDRVPRIRGWWPHVVLSEEAVAEATNRGDGVHAELLQRLLDERARDEGSAYGVMLLSPADDPETVRLAEPIVNDKVTGNGRPWAWTLGQRYASVDRLRGGITRTSQLESPG